MLAVTGVGRWLVETLVTAGHPPLPPRYADRPCMHMYLQTAGLERALDGFRGEIMQARLKI